MKRKRLILTVALGALAVAVLVCLPHGPKEPVFEGKKLGYWIRQALNSADTKEEEQAERAVKAAGTNALPYLLDQFTRRPSRTSRWVRQLNPRARMLFSFLNAETEENRIHVAVFGLSALGPDVAPALPVLVGELMDSRRGDAAAMLISRCGKEALPFLREAIKSTNYAVAQRLLNMTLSPTGEAQNVSAIEALLTDPDSETRRNTVVLVSSIRSFLAYAWLRRALHDSEPEIQIAVVDGLEKVLNYQTTPEQFTNMKQMIVNDLPTLITNSDERVARAASNALQRIDPAAMPSRGPLP